METYPPIVQSALARMDQNQRLTFQSEYNNRKKKLTPMIFATIFFLHFFFYDRVGLGVVYILVCFTVLEFVWYFVEICMIGKRMRDHNNDLAVSIARDMKIMS